MVLLAQPVPMARREKSGLLDLQELLVLVAPQASVERLAPPGPQDSQVLPVLMANQVPRVSKERLARRVTPALPALRAPLVLLGPRVLLV